MISALFILALTFAPGEGAEDVLLAADQAAQAHEYARASELCLEVIKLEDADEQIRQDALQASLGYADLAYDKTGSMTALCRAYASLVEHGVGEVLELKPLVEERLESIAGPSWRASCFAEPDVGEGPGNNDDRGNDIEARPPVPRNAQANTPTSAVAPLEPATSTSAAFDDSRVAPRSRLVDAGTVLVSVGAASLVGMSATFIVWNRNRARIDAITAAIENGAPMTPETNAEVMRLANSDDYLRPMAIATGTLGAAALVTGAALLIAGHERSREVTVAPAFTRTFGGLSLSARF